MPVSTPPASGPSAAPVSDTGFEFDGESPAPMQLDLVELDLALDLNDIAEHGFGQAVRQAARTVGGEFLFDLPASGLIENAQRIALVCLSRDNGGRFGLVLLSADGDRVRTVEADEDTMGLVHFARAFVAVLEKL
ncbi:hypothetical protein LL06_04900 [Hoeflea sp. BAL378]|nr:hypothetical protein LL06_04900 [Hoeflea sp. BAL378]